MAEAVARGSVWTMADARQLETIFFRWSLSGAPDLPMEVQSGGCGSSEQALQHTQLHTVIGNVIAATEQLNCLGLRWHVTRIPMIPVVAQVVLLRGTLHQGFAYLKSWRLHETFATVPLPLAHMYDHVATLQKPEF